MLKLENARWLQMLKRAFKTDESRFIISVGLKVSVISFAITTVVYYFIFQVMRLNYAFFKAQGFPDFTEESPFYDYIVQESLDNLPILFLFHIILFFIGTYIGWLILRPFRVIGKYAESVIENPNEIYKMEEFSTYNLLSRFSEFFFEYLRESRNRNQFISKSIPPQYLGIHKPLPDRIFMLHFGLLLIIISIASAVFIIEITSTIFQNIVELATKTLPNTKGLSKYFAHQNYIQDEIIYLTIFLTTLGYLMLGLHLYEKVSGAAFGIFSTMRSYMKGNYSSRVHLLGFAHIRDYTRKLNKYLEYMQNNFTKRNPPG
jgi:hypothetical protein